MYIQFDTSEPQLKAVRQTGTRNKPNAYEIWDFLGGRYGDIPVFWNATPFGRIIFRKNVLHPCSG
jgi:hypothetical protein